jgi:hypothetical protein
MIETFSPSDDGARALGDIIDARGHGIISNRRKGGLFAVLAGCRESMTNSRC